MVERWLGPFCCRSTWAFVFAFIESSQDYCEACRIFLFAWEGDENETFGVIILVIDLSQLEAAHGWFQASLSQSFHSLIRPFIWTSLQCFSESYNLPTATNWSRSSLQSLLQKCPRRGFTPANQSSGCQLQDSPSKIRHSPNSHFNSLLFCRPHKHTKLGRISSRGTITRSNSSVY